jgi:hypothetical protein
MLVNHWTIWHHIPEGNTLQDLIDILDITVGGFQYTCVLMKNHRMAGESTAMDQITG